MECMKNKYKTAGTYHLVNLALYTNVFVFLCLSLVSMHTIGQNNTNVKGAAQPKKIPDIILVKINKSGQAAISANSDSSISGIPTVDSKIKNKRKTSKVEKVLKPSKKADMNSDLARWVKIKINNPGQPATDTDGNIYYPDVDAIINDLKSDPNVESVQKDIEVEPPIVPNDTAFGITGTLLANTADMWGLNAIHAPDAWDTTTGNGSLVIADLDTGIDYNHPDLQGNIWNNTLELPANGIDDDHNGYIDDYRGWNFYNSNNDPFDDQGHGTHVAGTITATGNNNIGVAGVAWNSKLMMLKICSASCSYSLAATAIQYATDNGAKIIVNEYSGYQGMTIPIAADAFKYAHDRGVVLTTSAGNNSRDAIGEYPASDENSITVAAMSPTYGLSSFSNFGERIDVTAPGEYILSTKSSGWTYSASNCPAIYANGGNGYCKLQGTSMSQPHVSGIIALMLSVNPNLSPEQIRQILRTSSEDLGFAGRDSNYGYGLARADRAILAAQNPSVLTPYISSPKFGSTISGLTDIMGSISGPDLAQYKLELALSASATNWTTVLTGNDTIDTNSVITRFNSYQFANGRYNFRFSGKKTDNSNFEFTVFWVTINNVADYTPPSNPTNLTAIATPSTMSLQWTASSDNIGLDKYIVKRNGVVVGSPSTNNFIDSNLIPETTYSYSVQAVDLAGNNSSGLATASFTTTSDITPPTQPSGFIAQSKSKRSITLAWDSSSDNVAVVGYKIYRNGVLAQTTSSNSWIDSNLLINTMYNYAIEAYDAAGNISEQTLINTATLADTTPPSISFSSPGSGTSHARFTYVSVTAFDDESISKVELFLDSVLLKTFTYGPYDDTINLIAHANGAASLKAVATDMVGNTSQTILPIIVANPRRGDLNNDNKVDIFDLSLLLVSWGTSNFNKDLNGNNIIDIFDLSILLYEFGK